MENINSRIAVLRFLKLKNICLYIRKETGKQPFTILSSNHRAYKNIGTFFLSNIKYINNNENDYTQDKSDFKQICDYFPNNIINKNEKKELLKIEDFYYFNVYLLNDKEFVNFVLKYNFHENKNIYVSILIQLTKIYSQLTIKDIIDVLGKIFDKHKAAYSHIPINGEDISNLYSHICNNITKLNNLQLIKFLKCCSYTTVQYPHEVIIYIMKIILSKNLDSFNLSSIHDICNSLVKIKNHFKINKIYYDHKLQINLHSYLQNKLLNATMEQFFQNLPIYISVEKDIQKIMSKNENHLSDPITIKNDSNIIPASSLCEKLINFEKGDSLARYGNFVVNQEKLLSLKQKWKLIFLNKINEINGKYVLEAVSIYKWLDLKDSSLFTHICEIFVKNILLFDSKYIVRFFRKCHSLKFEKKNIYSNNNMNKSGENVYNKIKTENEINLENEEEINEKKSNKSNFQTIEQEDVGTNLLLNIINEKIYKMDIHELNAVTYGIYAFIENMKQFSNLAILKNNMNLLFSMSSQYIRNYINKEVCTQPKKLLNSKIYEQNEINTSEFKTIMKENTIIENLEKSYDINMNTEYMYISSNSIYLNKYKEPHHHVFNYNNKNGYNYSETRNIKYVSDVLLNISYFNISKNHKKIKEIYECINKLIINNNVNEDANSLLSLLMCLSNLYFKTYDNYIFDIYKNIIDILDNEKAQINGHHFNKLSFAISPILNEENKLIQKYSDFLTFFVQAKIVPLRSCVFLLQNIMKNLKIKLNDQLSNLKLAIINRIYLFMKESHEYSETLPETSSYNDINNNENSKNSYTITSHDNNNSDYVQANFKNFLLLHSINENTLICIVASLSLIIQQSKYGSKNKDDAIILLQNIISYIPINLFQKFPKKHIHTELLQAILPEHDQVKQILLSKM
ncbi:conserved Plasmodium protein, unknown function [Plasmodium berghei]|uniref:Uncharacterized protein n=2 Tax=Plasmodium berghei TaxID=5821 RepID=A0A509ANJ4_PLABA|nr:conserved Plasmodium protein, unknown function [Plasmodium berghei ANKA]CXI77767.1 conserved Plasmodium protein, unknown function [Plasmodium berghei]SCM25095.1 conserved Plasmodium protein, unknown function [Plasmodium berghei]SCN27260.1 conserved Plasmodium protein, unknown function [Plasmodium berghei]SCO61857.1 conserved Plasmodium protein, unknown function [Plasmodium berghei]SCO63686.1 conserved Plasmodium protein, unknown function [Plasmodium berghei]|eukprot:XP_034422896.1 conserved Plasmodium protein, unknown function [Plasmodium berghei ANKA]